MSTTSASRLVFALCVFASSVTLVGTACLGSDAPVVVVSSDGATSEGSNGRDAGADELPPVGGPGIGGDAGGTADSATGVDAAGPWTPAKIKGLVMWLDGDNATADVNGRVAAWSDKSGLHNDGTTAVDAQKPVLLTGASGLNTHQAVHFDGATTFMTIAEKASLKWTQSFVIEAVFRRIEASGAPIFWKSSASAGVFMSMGTENATPSVRFPEVAITVSGYGIFTDYNSVFPEGVPHRARAAFDSSSATISLQLDKLAPVSRIVAPPGVATYDAPGVDVLIGKQPITNRYLKADIGEIVAVAGATIDPADILMLQTYLDAKYGL
jgi:hypothetical protein